MLADRARATSTVRAMALTLLVGEHALQYRLIGLVGHHGLTQFLLAFVRLRGQDMASKGMTANDFACASFLEPLRRTFVSLELGHGCTWIFRGKTLEL